MQLGSQGRRRSCRSAIRLATRSPDDLALHLVEGARQHSCMAVLKKVGSQYSHQVIRELVMMLAQYGAVASACQLDLQRLQN